jgi:riboflavin-specific deaminase-like protein
VRRLLPDPGPASVDEQLDTYRPWEQPHEQRPFVAMNFAATVDGRATIDGVSGPIGSDEDTHMLARLRTRFDAVMIGGGTMRAERYGRLAFSEEQRRLRERAGLAPDPLMVIVSGRLDLPWDAPLFGNGGGRVLIFTASPEEAPEVATPLRVVRHKGRVDLAAALAQMRREFDVRALLCEGGPRLHAELESGGLVDELFLTVAPKLTGAGPSILEGELPAAAGCSPATGAAELALAGTQPDEERKRWTSPPPPR